MVRWLIERSLASVLLASVLVASCEPPGYRAYLINRSDETLYVTVVQHGGVRPYVSVVAADPAVAQDMGLEDAAPGEIKIRHADCSVLATLHLDAGEWTVVIDGAGTPSVASGAPKIPIRSVTYDRTACAAPPIPTSIP